MNEPGKELERVADELARAADRGVDAGGLARAGGALARSARTAGAGAVASGRWLAELAIAVAGRIPPRDAATLSAQHDGLTGDALAEALIRAASRASAAVGAAAGALIDAEELAPPAWLAIPGEIVVETLAIAAVEMKLVAELHEVYGRPVTGPPSARAIALAKAWAERRGVTAMKLAEPAGLAALVGQSTRREVARLVRRRMLSRMGRNLTSVAPLLAGAVAGAEVNRRATLAVGQAVMKDLRTH
jgi:hypothetical protein